jgi:hypothetical protein
MAIERLSNDAYLDVPPVSPGANCIDRGINRLQSRLRTLAV